MQMARKASIRKRTSAWSDQTAMHRKLLAALNPQVDRGSKQREQQLGQLMLRMLANKVEPGSPSLDIPRYLGDRWSPLILMVLSTGTFRHTELHRVINLLSEFNNTTAISQHILTGKLRALEREGLVDRKIWAVVPPRTDYSLTQLGEELMRVWWNVLRWVDDNAGRILLARKRYDSVNGG